MRRRQAHTHARTHTVTGSIWRVQWVRRRSERGALRFRDLVWSKPLGPNRIKRLGYYRPRCQRATEARETHSAFFFSSSTRVFPHARLPGVLNQHLPDSDYSPLAVVRAFIHSAVSGAITPVSCSPCLCRKKRKKRKRQKKAFSGL